MPKRTPQYMAAQRERILEAALACFAKNGFHGTSTDDIARAAKCGKSAIYAHFSSKRKIFEALSEREMQRYEGNPPRDLQQLNRYFGEALENLRTPRMQQLSRLSLHMVAESLADSEFHDWERRQFKRYMDWIEPLVRNDPSAAGLSDQQIREAARRLVFFWTGQSLYKAFMPNLSISMLQADLAAVVPALIQSVKQTGTKQARKSPSKQRTAARQSNGSGRVLRSSGAAARARR